MQLSRKTVIAAAVEIIEADGVEAVSMPRLATELGCGLISLYNYVPSRNALLDAVGAEVMSGIAGTLAPQPNWQDDLRAQIRAFRQVARAHPRCAMVAVSRRPAPASMARAAERALATLRKAGFGEPDAVRIARALAAYVLGSLLREAGARPGQAADDHPADADRDFEYGLDLIMQAVTARLK
jgi:AcrR family transcriptional regulator